MLPAVYKPLPVINVDRQLSITLISRLMHSNIRNSEVKIYVV